MYFFEINFPLPFLLPVEDGNTLVHHYDYGTYFVTFSKIKTRYKPSEKKRLVSLLKVKFDPKNSTPPPGLSSSDIIQDLFLLSLEYVNLILNAFSSTISFSGMHTITVADLPLVLNVYYRGDYKIYVTNPHGIIDNHFNELRQGDLKIILEKIGQWAKYPELALPDKLLEDAKQNMLKDRNAMAVIGFQTSMEVFLSNSMRIIMMKEGKSDSEIETVLDYPFRNMVEQHLAKKLNLNLKFDDLNNKEVFNWYNNLYLLRNKIVHNGLTLVPPKQAIKSFICYKEFRNIIGEAMVKQRYLDSYGGLDLGIFNRDFNKDEMKKIIAEDLKKMGITGKRSLMQRFLKISRKEL